MHKPVDETMKLLNLKLQGHCNYYGVSGNLKSIAKFYRYVLRRFMITMRRRSQKDRFPWPKLQRIWDYYITPPSIKNAGLKSRMR